MLHQTELEIRLSPGRATQMPDRVSFDRNVGGPETLLSWLEIVLGLPQADTHRAARVMQYASALAKVENACFEMSLSADAWETASVLLRRRDELMLCGWDGVSSDGCPQITRDLAAAEKEYTGSFPGEAERLAAVIDSLDAGQVLPQHQVRLSEELDVWPAVWQTVLRRLNVCSADGASPSSDDRCSLHAVGNVVRGYEVDSLDCDFSLRVTKARSETVATEFVASVLAEDFAKSPKFLERTVVYCENDALAIRLDASLQRRGVPTMGASTQTKAHPVLQVLPLALELCWEPVDPQCLLDLLTLPIIPFPRAIASRLAKAISEDPGLGSSAWDRTYKEICEESKADSTAPGKIAERLNTWFYADRCAADQPIETSMLASQCRKVARWAVGRATVILNDEDHSEVDVQVGIALHEASRQASLLGDLLELSGKTITHPQLGRLLDEVMDRGVESRPCLMADGGPTRVRSLSEIADGYDRLIWLGTTTADVPASSWSVKQLEDFADAGIRIDDGANQLRSLRSAEAKGLCLAKEAALVVALPTSEEQRVHPMWLAIEQKIVQHHAPNEWSPVAIEELLDRADCDSLTPFVFTCESVAAEATQPARPLWDIPSRLLKDRETVSASELEVRLACPLKWTFQYQAVLRPSEIASLPNDFRLRGNLFHSILDRVFGNGGRLPDADEAVALVDKAFDERLPLDAAPLAQPEKRVESQRLKGELLRATRLFVETLTRGGYTSVNIEDPIDSSAFGKPLKGWIDCVASSDDGREAVVDFKYGGRKKYYDMILEGETVDSVQLATYAFSRRQVSGAFPSVAYLVLSDGKFFTPSGSPLEGVDQAQVIEGRSIEHVWNNFSQAITHAEEWLASDTPVPARPLQPPEDWPDGATIVLKEKLERNKSQSVCLYCDFKRLCGKEAVR